MLRCDMKKSRIGIGTTTAFQQFAALRQYSRVESRVNVHLANKTLSCHNFEFILNYIIFFMNLQPLILYVQINWLIDQDNRT